MCVGQHYHNNVKFNGDHNFIQMNTYLSNTCVPYLNTHLSNVKYIPTDIIAGTSYSNVLQCDSTIDINGKVKIMNMYPVHFSATSQRELGERMYYYFSQ